MADALMNANQLEDALAGLVYQQFMCRSGTQVALSSGKPPRDEMYEIENTEGPDDDYLVLRRVADGKLFGVSVSIFAWEEDPSATAVPVHPKPVPGDAGAGRPAPPSS